MNVFDTLMAVNVNGHTEKKNAGGVMLTYLSWPFAWSEVKLRYPDAYYEVVKFDGLPYVYDPRTGYMVYTRVTIEGITHEMWLPVMDGANKAMKDEPYTYTTGYGQNRREKICEAATMFDVNKTIMRCLVKNLAMFGLGLYIYAGEDLPVGSEEQEPAPKAVTRPQEAAEPTQANENPDAIENAPIGPERAKALRMQLEGKNVNILQLCKNYKVRSLSELTEAQMGRIVRAMRKS